MSTDTHRQDYKPPPPTLEEGYWESLLSEGEFTDTKQPEIDYITSPTDHQQQTSEPEAYQDIENWQEFEEDWLEIQEIANQDNVIELNVTGYNRGGLLVEWRSLRGFVPASQLINFPSTANISVRRNALIDRIGTSLKLRIIELSSDKNRLILSERAALAAPGERDEILQGLDPGETVEGIVTNLCDFGAFIDLGGLEGLIHISELSWGRVGHPSSILQRGQNIKAYVIDVDHGAGRIALSLKRLRPDPWKTVNERYQLGQTVEGIITNVVDFGAFACIEDGLEGLIHVSELAEGHFLHPRNVVSEGQTVQARILSINGDQRRLGLSLRLNS